MPTKEVTITIKAKIIENGNSRKVGYIEYKHDKHPGYDILAVLTQVQAETMIKAKPPTVQNDEWLLEAIKLSANALHSALAARLADLGKDPE